MGKGRSILMRTPTDISSIFFSGSQSVTKGAAVTWILEDTWAFKTTEKCAVSTNASPFVQLDAGQTFLIYKRTQADIDAGNYKGIYVFDRDTILALAYSQEVTQDIVIENDIYNNNMSNITIEGDLAPIVSAGGNKAIVIGQSVDLKGSAVAKQPTPPPANPVTIASVKWLLDGVTVSTSYDYTFKGTALGSKQLVFMATDSGGRIASDRISVNVKDVPELPKPYVVTNSFYLDINSDSEGRWANVIQVEIAKNVTGVNTITAAIPIAKFRDTIGFWLRIVKNGNIELGRAHYMATDSVVHMFNITETDTNAATGDTYTVQINKDTNSDLYIRGTVQMKSSTQPTN